MSATTQAKRLRRVERRAIPEVIEAVHAGKLSVRMADQLLYLPRGKQKAELRSRLKAIEDRERISGTAAEAIRGYLNALDGNRPDLHQLAGIVRSVLARLP